MGGLNSLQKNIEDGEGWLELALNRFWTRS